MDKKTLTLPLSYQEIGEILIQGAPGYKPQDREKWLKKFAIEGFLHSMTPAGQHKHAMKVKLNPGHKKKKRRKHSRKELMKLLRNPKLPLEILQIADQLNPLEPMSLLSEFEGEERLTLDHRIRGAVGQLTRALLAARMELEPKDFAIGKNATEEQMRQVYIHQYTAYVVAMTIMAALNPVFAITNKTLQELTESLKQQSLRDLNASKNRKEFSLGIYRALKIPSGEMEEKLRKARVEAK